MACDAVSMGIKDDAVVAAILLHDVCEDCSVSVVESGEATIEVLENEQE